MKKTIMTVGVALAIAGVATVGTVGVTHAASNLMSPSVTRHTERARGEAKLNQAERDGVITDTQKQAFMTEAKALKAERKTVISKTSTTAERQAERTKLKTELKTWATTNNFPLAKIFPKLAE